MIIDNLIELNTIEKNDLNAEQSHVLKDKLYVGKAGIIEIGTIPDNGAVTKTLAAGESYAISLGYHNGNGIITAKTLAEQTTATANASHILAPYTAWVTGGKITGTMVNRTGWTGSVAMNGSIVIPQGYHNGSGKVNGPNITQMTGFTIIRPSDKTQTFQTANKYLTGNISCEAASILPPSVVKKGYTYKVGDTTYVGTFEGSADDKYYITFSDLGDFKFTCSSKDNMSSIDTGYGFNLETPGQMQRYIYVNGKAQGFNTWGLSVSALKVKLNNRRTVDVKYSTNNLVSKAYFGFSKNGGLTISSPGSSPGLDVQYNIPSNSSGVATADISKLNGDYYFYIFMQPAYDLTGVYAEFHIDNICAIV